MRRSAVLALTLLGAGARAGPTNRELESWGAYEVRHLALPPVEHGLAVLPDSTVAVASGDNVYFYRPNGTLVGQSYAEGRVGGPPVVLRDGGLAVISFRVNGDIVSAIILKDKSVTVSHTVVFFGPDRRKRGEYAAHSPKALTALNDGGAAVSEDSGLSLVFLGPDGARRGVVSLETCWKDPWSLSAIVELPDGRLLLRQDINPQRTCVVSPDRKSAYGWTIENGRGSSEARWASPGWRMKSGVLVGSDGEGVAFMDAKGAVLRRVNAPIGDSTVSFGEAAGLKDGRLWLTELRDGGVAAGSAVTGLVLVMDGRGRERWRFKASGAIGGEPLELRDGSIVVGSRDHSVYFLSKAGGLLGRYLTEGEVMSRLAGFEDGTILAAIGRSAGASHNLLLFTPTGRPFVAPASQSGKRCRIVDSSQIPTTLLGHKPCPTDVETLPMMRDSSSTVESLCTTTFPGSRTTNLRILGCRAMPPGKRVPKSEPDFTFLSDGGPNVPWTRVALGYDCEDCSDAP